MISAGMHRNPTLIKNSQNTKQMKKLRAIFSLLLLSAVFAIGQTLTVLNKGDRIIAPNDLTVVMDKNTFGKYAYTADKYDTLKQKITEYDSVLTARDSIQERVISDYRSLVSEKENERDIYRSGYEDMKGTLQESIDRNNKLQIDYKKLEHKNRRIKRWRNILAGSTFISTGIIILMIVI